MKTSLTVLSFLLFAALGIAHAQTLTILKRTTSATEGSFLVSAPILASDGKVYGIASSGGLNTNGAIYRMNADGSGYVPLLQFASATSGRGNTSPIIEATNGKLYGACPFGGTNNGGTLWRMDKSGANFEVLVAFLPAVDGDRCCSGLIQASDGKLYGTTYSGTGGTAGGIFRMDPDAGGSSFQQLHAFSMATEGKASVGTVLEGSDGRIYGTTSESAANNYGTIWRIDKD
ncbi:MAG: choice-of-anchor tandem repeat GloVer-containing protein, partial [Chthoniobacterales bacterium]